MNKREFCAYSIIFASLVSHHVDKMAVPQFVLSTMATPNEQLTLVMIDTNVHANVNRCLLPLHFVISVDSRVHFAFAFCSNRSIRCHRQNQVVRKIQKRETRLSIPLTMNFVYGRDFKTSSN